MSAKYPNLNDQFVPEVKMEPYGLYATQWKLISNKKEQSIDTHHNTDGSINGMLANVTQAVALNVFTWVFLASGTHPHPDYHWKSRLQEVKAPSAKAQNKIHGPTKTHPGA